LRLGWMSMVELPANPRGVDGGSPGVRCARMSAGTFGQ
jgi:hypothetical protein